MRRRRRPSADDGTSALLPGFKAARVKTSGAEINLVHARSGPPLLLLHGAPQSHVSWRLVAPELAKTHTVVVPDLRGYGDSSKPPDGENHVNYSKRAMALDQVEVMKHFGFDKFPVVGHDRGGRVGHRLALDHPDKVTRLAVLDIVPTYYLYTHVTIEFVQAYFHWFNYVRAAPGPEERSQGAVRGAAGAGDHRRADRIPARQQRPRQHPRRCARTIAPAPPSTSSTTKRTWTKKIACPLLDAVGPEGTDGPPLRRARRSGRSAGRRSPARDCRQATTCRKTRPAEVLAELRAFL